MSRQDNTCRGEKTKREEHNREENSRTVKTHAENIR